MPSGHSSSITYDPTSLLITNVTGPICNCGGDQTRNYAYLTDGSQRLYTVSDDGNGSGSHTITFTYGRDSGGFAYPGPTVISENLASGQTRTWTLTYYPINDSANRKDLVSMTQSPSVDTSGKTMTIADSYSSGSPYPPGLLTQEIKTGYVNGTSTPYTSSWTYDSRGRMLTSTGPRTDVVQKTTMTYFSDADSDMARAGQLETVIDALGHTTTYSGQLSYNSYTPFGDPQSERDPNGVITEYTYDLWGRPLSRTLLGEAGDPDPLTTSRAYDAAGRLTLVTKPLGNSTAYAYDTSDRLSAVARDDSSGLQHEVLVMDYNANDQPTAAGAALCTQPAANCSAWTTTWGTSYSYSPTTSDLSRVTSPDGTYRQYSYVGQGLLAAYNDENHPTGSNYSYTYDFAGRPLTRTRKLGSGTVSTAYVNDIHDNVTSVTDPNGNITTYHFDDFDRVTKEVSPVQGTTLYIHDPDGNLTKVTDSTGAVATYTYDALDRKLTEVAEPQGLSSAWTYDDMTTGHFGIGRLASVVDPSGSTTYTYERRGLLTSESKVIVGNAFTQTYGYDYNGNRNGIDYADGLDIGYGFDFADRPYSVSSVKLSNSMAALARSERFIAHEAQPESGRTTRQRFERKPVFGGHGALRATDTGLQPASNSVRRAASTLCLQQALVAAASPRLGSVTNYVCSATYEPFGPLTSIQYVTQSSQTFTYDQRYRPLTNSFSASISGSYSYGYDAVGNITSITDNKNAAYDRTYGPYDDLNRLTTANSGASLWGTASGNGYTYDSMGNMTSLKLGTTRTDAFTYKPGVGSSVGLPELASVTENSTKRNITYDAFGNELTDGLSTFTYSSRELLASDSRFVTSYYYDAFRQRAAVQLSTNGSFIDYLRDPDQRILSETAQFKSGSPPIAYDYVWFGDRPVLQIAPSSGATLWTFSDHLGAPISQENSTQTITWWGEYEPYGALFSLHSGTSGYQPNRFPGQFEESFSAGSGNNSEREYNNARWYLPNWGRYTQADPIRLAGGLNLFSYGAANPITMEDPSGTTCETNWKYFWHWVAGPGEWINYYPEDIETQEMEKSPAATKMRATFYLSGCKSITFNYGSMEAFRDTWKHLACGTDGEVGGFAGARLINDGDGNMTFVIPNVTGTNSFFYHAVPDIETGMMGKIHQTFYWTERIDSALCKGCRAR